MTADPKQEPRVKDTDALRKARLMFDECAACGGPPANAHHVIEKGSPHFGDDVPGNIVMLCGSGTMGCHGAYHGSPYVHESTGTVLRRDQVWVRCRIGEHLAEHRPDVLAYVLGKLGDGSGRAFLERTYFIWEDDEGFWKPTRALP